MGKEHIYNLQIEWTGNKGEGTSSYTSYGRDFTLSADNRPNLFASADPAFRGDKSKYNPEDFLLASISSCHMLWFLHLCADAGINVVEYVDNPVGKMVEGDSTGGGRFIEATLNPSVIISNHDKIDLVSELHYKAHEKCFISNSVNFPIHINSQCQAK